MHLTLDIRRTLPVRERSPLPRPMENRESTVDVSRIGSAAEIDELEYILNSEDSNESEWGAIAFQKTTS